MNSLKIVIFISIVISLLLVFWWSILPSKTRKVVFTTPPVFLSPRPSPSPSPPPLPPSPHIPVQPVMQRPAKSRAASAQKRVPPPESPWVRLHKEDTPEPAPIVQFRQPLCPTPYNLARTTRTRRYTFQSDARDTTLYPTPSKYRMNLPVPQKNVIAIGLNLAVIPISEYNINPYTQWLDIFFGATLYSVMMPEGNYTAATLPAQLQAAIVATNAALAAFTVTLSPFTNKITINTNGGPCSLLFFSGPHVNVNMWQIIGFPRQDTPSNAVQVAPNVIDTIGTLAIDFFIPEIANNIESTDNAFARIDLSRFGALSEHTYFTPPGDGLPLTFWPISRLTFLTFEFRVRYTKLEPDGTIIEAYRPYLFNGRNNTIRLDIITREYKSPLEETIELEATT